MEYPERPECDFTVYPVNYTRCSWCHGVRSEKQTLYQNKKPFCSVKCLHEWGVKDD